MTITSQGNGVSERSVGMHLQQHNQLDSFSPIAPQGARTCLNGGMITISGPIVSGASYWGVIDPTSLVIY